MYIAIQRDSIYPDMPNTEQYRTQEKTLFTPDLKLPFWLLTPFLYIYTKSHQNTELHTFLLPQQDQRLSQDLEVLAVHCTGVIKSVQFTCLRKS